MIRRGHGGSPQKGVEGILTTSQRSRLGAGSGGEKYCLAEQIGQRGHSHIYITKANDAAVLISDILLSTITGLVRFISYKWM